jgi:hypothetical protein
VAEEVQRQRHGAAGAAGTACKVYVSMGSRGSVGRVAGGRRKIHQWWTYKIYTAAAPVEDWRRSAADIGEGSELGSGEMESMPFWTGAPAEPSEQRPSPVRRGTQDKHGWLGRRQWRLQ